MRRRQVARTDRSINPVDGRFCGHLAVRPAAPRNRGRSRYVRFIATEL